MLPYWGHDEEELSEYLCRTTPSLHWSSNWCSPIKAQAVWKTLNPEGPPTSTYCQAIVKPLSIWCLLQTQVLQRREEHHPPGTRRSRCRISECTTLHALLSHYSMSLDSCSMISMRFLFIFNIILISNRWLSLTIADYRCLSLSAGLQWYTKAALGLAAGSDLFELAARLAPGG